MGTIFIPYEDNNFSNVIGGIGRIEINRIRDAAPKHPGTVYVYVLGERKNSPFEIGKKVYVKSPSYDFSATIWYIYQGANGYNLYLKTAYKGEDYSGAVSLNPIIEVATEVPPFDSPAGNDLPPASESIAETVAKGGSINLVFVAIAAIAGYFLFFRKGKGKKGGKGKK